MDMGYPVLNENGNLVSILTHHDIYNSILEDKYDLKSKTSNPRIYYLHIQMNPWRKPLIGW